MVRSRQLLQDPRVVKFEELIVLPDGGSRIVLE